MRPRVSRVALIWALVRKDLSSFARDKMWLVLTPFSFFFVVAAFLLAPDAVDDTVGVGISPPESAALMGAIQREEQDSSVLLVPFDDEERMVAAVEGSLTDPTEDEDRISLGVAFPEDFAETVGSGVPAEVTLVVDDSVPVGLAAAFEGEIRESAFAIEDLVAGRDPAMTIPVEMPADDELVIGVDRIGNLIGMRDKISPMMALMMLMLGSIAIAGLVAIEIEQRTATALLVTPVSTSDFLAAKGITGCILGTVQGLLFLVLTGSLGDHTWTVLLAVAGLVVIGALMMSALGMIAGAAGRDFMSTMFLAVALLLPAFAPTFAVLFPGSRSLWVKLMPSWGLVEAMVEMLGYGTNPADLLGYFALTAAWTVGLLGLALWLLKRRVEAL